MTLQDYAKGDFWVNDQNQNRPGIGSAGIYSEFGKSNNPR